MQLHAQQDFKDVGSTELEAKVNVHHDNHNVGFAVKHDLAAFTQYQLQASLQDGPLKYFAKLNLEDKHNHVSAGFTTRNIQKRFARSYQFSYLLGGAKGWMGQPISVQHGGKYQLSKDARMEFTLEAAEHYQAHTRWWYKVDKHWKVAAHQHFDTARIGSKRNAYDLGFEITYKL